MIRVDTALFILVMLLSGCNQGTKIAKQPPNPGTSATPDLTGVFEIRDLKTQKDTDIRDYFSSMTYKARGTLVARDPSLQKGAYLVILSVKGKRQGEQDQDGTAYVEMNEGMATVEAQEYISWNEKDANERQKKEKPPRKYTWKMVGYAELKPGKVRIVE